IRGQLEAAAKRANDNFPANEYLRIENGEPVLKRLQRKPEPEGLSRLEQQLVEHMTHVDIVDALSHTEHWLNWRNTTFATAVTAASAIILSLIPTSRCSHASRPAAP